MGSQRVRHNSSDLAHAHRASIYERKLKTRRTSIPQPKCEKQPICRGGMESRAQRTDLPTRRWRGGGRRGDTNGEHKVETCVPTYKIES